MELALRRINIPDQIITILKHIHTNRKDQIITSQGLTDPYDVEDGLDQGETYSPLLWRIFYDPILLHIHNTNKEHAYILQKEDMADVVEDRDSVAITHLAFVDDTAWISNTKEGLHKIFTTAAKIYKEVDIQINFNKCEIIRVGPREMTSDAITVDDRAIPILRANIPARYLGI